MTALAAIGLLVMLARLPRSDERAPAGVDSVSPFDVLAASATSSDDGFTRVPSSWAFTFPTDHGRHREYRTESWHVTGTLSDERGRLLGAQLLLVRIGLRAQAPDPRSAWTASEIYAGLFSLSDPYGRRLDTGSRLSRGALGLAGATVEPIRIWIEDWQVEGIGLAEDTVDLTLRARTADVELDLELRNVRPLIAASDVGAGALQPNAPFQFYVQPRLSASGRLARHSEETAVEGSFSVEHAWGELPLPGGPIATDRFTLHLDDQREVFVMRTHRTDGAGMATTTALLVARNERPAFLSDDDMELRPVGHWTSMRTGARYPIRWRLRIPSHDINMKLVPQWENQEGVEWMTFWAGPVTLERIGSGSQAGDGFIQLYGYTAP